MTLRTYRKQPENDLILEGISDGLAPLFKKRIFGGWLISIGTKDPEANLPDNCVHLHFPCAGFVFNTSEPRHHLPRNIPSYIVFIFQRSKEGRYGNGNVREGEGDEVGEDEFEDCGEVRASDGSELS